jgi:hypothetical protein
MRLTSFKYSHIQMKKKEEEETNKPFTHSLFLTLNDQKQSIQQHEQDVSSDTFIKTINQQDQQPQVWRPGTTGIHKQFES